MMRVPITTLLLCLSLFGLNAQSVSENLITTNFKQGGIHHLETKTISLVVRANYSYDLHLVNGVDGIHGNLISKDGAISERGDEIIFVNAQNKRRNFAFNRPPTKYNLSGRPIYQNNFTIDPAGLQWLKTEKPVQFYLKNTLLLQMKKYSLPISRRQLFQELVSQFEQTLDYKLTNQSSIVAYTPSKKKKIQKSGKSEYYNETNDDEIRLLLKQKESVKQSILKQIKDQKAKGQRIKDVLHQEVLDAQLNASIQKNSYTQEVIAARNKSFLVINEINKNTENELREQKNISRVKKEEFAREVYQARLKSNKELERIKLESENKIVSFQKELVTGIKKAEEKYKTAEQDYDEEIIKTIRSSQKAIAEIRNRTFRQMDSLNLSYQQMQKHYTKDQQESFRKENGKLLTFRKIIIDSLARMEEKLVRKKEEFAQSIAAERILHQEKINSIQKKHSLAIQENNIKLQNQILKAKEAALIEETKYQNEAKTQADHTNKFKAYMKGRRDSIRYFADQQIIKNRHLLESKLQKITNDIIEAEHRKDDALLRIKGESEYDISKIQNIVREERRKMLNVIELERKTFVRKKNELNEEEARIVLHQKNMRDSMRNMHVKDIIDLRRNYDLAVKRIHHNRESILNSLDSEYKRIKLAYADSIRFISAKANSKIASIKDKQAAQSNFKKEDIRKEISRINEHKEFQEKILKDREKRAHDILRLKKEHQVKLSDLHKKLDSEIHSAFQKIIETKSSFRDEMNIMSRQLTFYKTQHQDDLISENQNFSAEIALTRNIQLSQLLRLDSVYQAKRSTILANHAREFKNIRSKSQIRLTALQDSLRAIYNFENEALSSLMRQTRLKKDSLIHEQNVMVSQHNKKINESNKYLLKEMIANEEILTNEVYLARQKAREAIARIKTTTLDEINTILFLKRVHKKEIEKLKKEISLKKAELERFNKN